MGEVLGIGITHYPPLLGKPEHYADLMRRYMKSPLISEEMKDPKNWPAPMQDEWDHEVERAKVHQEQHVAAFRKVRRAIDEFNPDAVIIFGDDQYENYKEDLIPPFAIHIREEIVSQPFMRYKLENNVWGESMDKAFVYKGHRDLSHHLATELIERGFPTAYSMRDSHYELGLSHAFANGLAYLDWDRKGFPYPIIPVATNAYGKDVVRSRGGSIHLFPEEMQKSFTTQFAPPGPTPRSCFQLGQAIREIVEEGSERVVIMASSGWSHAFLVEKHHWLWPDLEADRKHVEQLKAGEHRQWADITNDEIHDAGDQEFKNWICLAGAMEDCKADVVEYLETYIFNSCKCFAVFQP